MVGRRAALTHRRPQQVMTETPYSSPDSADPVPRGHGAARLGLVLFAAPVVGVAGTAVGMIYSFNSLAREQEASPVALSHAISGAMLSTAIGILVGFVGAFLLLRALLALGVRERWFFWWSVALAGFWCLALFPIGLIVGVPVLILFFARRGEFRDASAAGARETRVTPQ